MVVDTVSLITMESYKARCCFLLFTDDVTNDLVDDSCICKLDADDIPVYITGLRIHLCATVRYKLNCLLE